MAAGTPNHSKDWPAIVIVGATVLLLILAVIGLIMPESAEMDIKALETAVMAYKIKCGDYPASLDELCQYGGGLPFIEKSRLTDPWGRPYIYSPNNLHPTTGIPQISSAGPPGENAPIRNWELKKPGS
jgi:hypothetical protein